MYGVQYGYMYTARCLMKIEPLKNLSAMLFFSMLVFAYQLKICESPYATSSMDFRYFFNAFWCVIITMTTSFLIRILLFY